jgi:hypothetical protein
MKLTFSILIYIDNDNRFSGNAFYSSGATTTTLNPAVLPFGAKMILWLGMLYVSFFINDVGADTMS